MWAHRNYIPNFEVIKERQLWKDMIQTGNVLRLCMNFSYKATVSDFFSFCKEVKTREVALRKGTWSLQQGFCISGKEKWPLDPRGVTAGWCSCWFETALLQHQQHIYVCLYILSILHSLYSTLQLDNASLNLRSGLLFFIRNQPQL